MRIKGSLSPLKNENKLDEDFYCTLHKFVLIRFIHRNQGHRDSVMHEFHSNVNKVNKAVAKVRTIGDRLPLSFIDFWHQTKSLLKSEEFDLLGVTHGVTKVYLPLRKKATCSIRMSFMYIQ